MVRDTMTLGWACGCQQIHWKKNIQISVAIVIQIAIPRGASPSQVKVLQEATKYGKSNGVENIQVIK